MRKFTICERLLSLYSFENDVILHWATNACISRPNCMGVSCLRLPRGRFYRRSIDRQFDGAAREFVNRTKNVRLDPAGRRAWLSGIFDFYIEDFLARTRYRVEHIPPEFEVRFLDYD